MWNLGRALKKKSFIYRDISRTVHRRDRIPEFVLKVSDEEHMCFSGAAFSTLFLTLNSYFGRLRI